MIVVTEMELKGAAQGNGKKYDEFLGKEKSVSVSVNCLNIVEVESVLIFFGNMIM